MGNLPGRITYFSEIALTIKRSSLQKPVDDFKVDDSAYHQLEDCCQYKRKELSKAKNKPGLNNNCKIFIVPFLM